MKVLYFGDAGCSDSDFPLIRALQLQGIDIYSYFYICNHNSKAGLFNIQLKKKNAIIPASQYEGLKIYSGYLDLTKMFVINHFYSSRRNVCYWLYGNIWRKLYKHMEEKKAQILHLTWPLMAGQRILYGLNLKIVQTIHDPFPHSGQYTPQKEAGRIEAIRKADSIILLSTPQLESFCEYYHVSRNKVLLNKMGEFNHLRLLQTSKLHECKEPYILYVGQIQEHKGIEFLLQAMVKTHSMYPDVRLIIAGKGKFPFNISLYENLDYIEFKNYYIEVKEMVDLLVNCLFAVCPYKDATQSGVVQTAFSLDVPLIVTNVGDLPLSVQDGVTGKVVPPCNVNALSEAINELLSCPNQLELYKNNIDKIWRKGQRWEPIAQKYIEEYKKKISNN